VPDIFFSHVILRIWFHVSHQVLAGFLRGLVRFLVCLGRVNDVDSVQLAECLDISPVIPEENDLVKSLHITAILDIIHLDLDACTAASGWWCVDIADHCACVKIE